MGPCTRVWVKGLIHVSFSDLNLNLTWALYYLESIDEDPNKGLYRVLF